MTSAPLVHRVLSLEAGVQSTALLKLSPTPSWSTVTPDGRSQEAARPLRPGPGASVNIPVSSSPYKGLRRPQIYSYPVTDRQREALVWVARGCTAQQGADRMNIKLDTYNSLLRKAYRKLGALNGPHAVAVAMASGLIAASDLSAGTATHRR